VDIKAFDKLKIDLSPLGFNQNGVFENYYCTPRNAKIIASSDVDGIHYCTIPQFGEIIFAVSPMNFGDCVHPIALNFEDLLRLLLHCVDIAALEQNVQVVVLTNFGQNQFALELTDKGAFDFVNKPWNNDKLLVTLRNAYRMRQLSNALKHARNDAPCQKQFNDGKAYPDLTIEHKGCQETGYATSEEIKEESSGREKGNERIFTLEQMEKKMMKAAIKRNRGNISLAAEQLGVTRQTLYNKGKKYKLFE
jgi:DNA-binding NtrC family response regulator